MLLQAACITPCVVIELRLALAQHIDKQEFWTLGSVHADALQCPIANNISLIEFIPAIVKWAVGLGHRLQCTRVGKSALDRRSQAVTQQLVSMTMFRELQLGHECSPRGPVILNAAS